MWITPWFTVPLGLIWALELNVETTWILELEFSSKAFWIGLLNNNNNKELEQQLKLSVNLITNDLERVDWPNPKRKKIKIKLGTRVKNEITVILAWRESWDFLELNVVGWMLWENAEKMKLIKISIWKKVLKIYW